jgi:hypothetical protein
MAAAVKKATYDAVAAKKAAGDAATAGSGSSALSAGAKRVAAPSGYTSSQAAIPQLLEASVRRA